ncbi:hypothetical protein BH10PSE19_BH10PSE19_05910 [soil metagenome]
MPTSDLKLQVEDESKQHQQLQQNLKQTDQIPRALQ